MCDWERRTVECVVKLRHNNCQILRVSAEFRVILYTDLIITSPLSNIGVFKHVYINVICSNGGSPCIPYQLAITLNVHGRCSTAIVLMYRVCVCAVYSNMATSTFMNMFTNSRYVLFTRSVYIYIYISIYVCMCLKYDWIKQLTACPYCLPCLCDYASRVEHYCVLCCLVQRQRLPLRTSYINRLLGTLHTHFCLP